MWTLAQSTPLPGENPFGYGAVGLLLAICIWLIWTFIQDLRAQRDRLQVALDVQRDATLAALDATRELGDLGRLMRRVLEALPQVDDTPPPSGRRRP